MGLVRARAAAERLPTNTSTVSILVREDQAFELTNCTAKCVFLFRATVTFYIRLPLAVLDVFVIVLPQEHLLTLGALKLVFGTRTVVSTKQRQ